MLNSLAGSIFLPKYTTFLPKNVTSLIWRKCTNVAGHFLMYSSLNYLEHHIIVSLLLLVSDGV